MSCWLQWLRTSICCTVSRLLLTLGAPDFHLLQNLLNIAGLGVRIVLVIGARQQIDELLEKQGEAPQYAAGYRVTDSVAMQTAVQAAGSSRMAVEARL